MLRFLKKEAFCNYNKVAVILLILCQGCVNHPSYWSEESCEYCIKQNEHYIRVHKDEMTNSRIRKIEQRLLKVEEKETK